MESEGGEQAIIFTTFNLISFYLKISWGSEDETLIEHFSQGSILDVERKYFLNQEVLWRCKAVISFIDHTFPRNCVSMERKNIIKT